MSYVEESRRRANQRSVPGQARVRMARVMQQLQLAEYLRRRQTFPFQGQFDRLKYRQTNYIKKSKRR